MDDDYIILDLRDERGRFFAQPKIPMSTYLELELHAKLQNITFEEVLQRAIHEHAVTVLGADHPLVKERHAED